MEPLRKAFLVTATIAVMAAWTGSSDASFREQQNFQFRGAAELNAALAREQARLQANGLTQGGILSSGARQAAPSAVGPGSAITSSSTTVGNLTNGTATVTVTGNNNTITLDGFLNVSPTQENTGQNADVDHTIGIGD